MTITIRPSTDFVLLDKLDRQTLPPPDELYEKNSPGTFWWVAWDGNTPAGYCGLRICPDTNEGFLTRAGVLPPYRGMGIQKRLIRVRERKAKKAGMVILATYTSRDNPASANSLISCGFKVYEPSWEWGVKNAIYFYKNL